ncbi:MAG: hypothetical protein ACI89L_000713 [Phycisphaerales bacterium]
MTTLDSSQHPTIRSLRHTLRRVRTRTRRVLLWRSVGRLMVTLGLGLLGLILIDFVLRFPAAIRWVLLLGGLTGLVHLLNRWVLPAWRFGPSPTDLALRLERAAGDEWRGRLASGLELADATDADPEADAIRLAAVARAMQGFTPALVARAVDAAVGRRWVLAALATLVLCAGLAWVQPQSAKTGLTRVLAPWAQAEWPRRQVVAHVGSASVLPIDRAVPIRADVRRTNRAAGETPVWAEYRIVVGNDSRPWERVRLTAQGTGLTRNAVQGELYERLIEPGVTEEQAASGEVTLEYRLKTEDDRTRRRTVRLVQPPRVTRGEMTITLPAYADSLDAAAAFGSGVIELGDGHDGRGVVGPVLAGSHVNLRVEFNKPVPVASITELARGFAIEGEMSIAPDPARTGATLAGVIQSPVLLPLILTDEHGIITRGEPSYRVEVVEDLPPTVAVVEPQRDEQVLATAVVDVRTLGEDDLGLREVSLWAQVFPVASSEGPAGDLQSPSGGLGEILLGRTELAGQTAAEVTATIDLAPLGLAPGDEVRLIADATDVFASAAGEPHATARSRPRVLRVISETTLIDQVRAELGGVRRAAMRLDEEQARIETGTRARDDEQRPAAELADQQDTLARRLDQQRDATARLSERLQRNALDSPALEDLLAQSEEILKDATESADEAAERLARDDREEAEEQQQEVRDDLARLVGLLDRGEDSWLARQNLQRLLADQRELQEQTAQMQEQTLGRELDELNADERTELQKIADRQRAAAQRASEAIDELADAAERLQDRDAAQAAALEQAAASARRARLPERLEEAAGQIGDNQTQQAQQQQQQAIDDLEDALKQLDEGEKIRDETLRRMLASLVESLEILVDDQLFALTRLEEVDDVRDPAHGLDAGMVSIYERTMSAAEQAASGGGDVAVITERLGRAGDAQERAITALRADGAQADRVRGFERTSLDHLEAALAEAKQAEEQTAARAAERERAELRQEYTRLAELQRAAIANTLPLIERALDRRERAEARAVADAQDQIAQGVEQLATDYESITESPVFELAHRRIASLSEAVSEALRNGSPGARDTRSQESVAALLEQLAASLTSDPDSGEGFEQDSASSQGGGGGGSGGDDPPAIPPLAELQVLRMLQEQAAALTQQASDTGEAIDLDDAVTLQREVAQNAQGLLDKINENDSPPADLPASPEGANPTPTTDEQNDGEHGGGDQADADRPAEGDSR